jgi:hypothetical protein
MVKKIVCRAALLTVSIALAYQPAAAQDYLSSPPKQSIQQYGPFKNSAGKSPAVKQSSSKSTSAGSCGDPAGHCLFYGGNFLDDPLYPPFLPDGLANETNLLVPGSPYGAATWVPFTVKGKDWEVTGLFTNNLALYGVLDQAPNTPTSAAFYSINTGVAAGDAGTDIASGTAAATSTATGRSAFGLIEYTVQITGLSFPLAPGSYWMAVVPMCTNAADPYCDGAFFLSDVEYLNTTPASAQGTAEPVDAAFFDSPFFGFSFYPTYGPLGACLGNGCDAFSAGVLGETLK